MTGLRLQLIWAIQALAYPAEIQLSLFPSHVCKVDELALDFDVWSSYTLAHELAELTDQQVHSLEFIDNKLNVMTEDKSLWSEEALRTSLPWQEIRQLALAALHDFDCTLDIPPADRSQYSGP